jgi:hypothetical protein
METVISAPSYTMLGNCSRAYMRYNIKNQSCKRERLPGIKGDSSNERAKNRMYLDGTVNDPVREFKRISSFVS